MNLSIADQFKTVGMFPPSFPENFNAQEWKGIFVQALENVSFKMHYLSCSRSTSRGTQPE